MLADLPSRSLSPSNRSSLHQEIVLMEPVHSNQFIEYVFKPHNVDNNPKVLADNVDHMAFNKGLLLTGIFTTAQL